jgi:hypothetical protein
MKLQHHTAFSAVISGVLFILFRSWGLAISSFIAGVFIDLDHFLDVIREHGWSIKIKDFFWICHKSQFDRIILLWHGWEWLGLLGIAAWLTGWNPWITGILIGFGQHLVIDASHNSSNPLSYSLIWRWKNNFDFDKIFSSKTTDKYIHKKHSLNVMKNN